MKYICIILQQQQLEREEESNDRVFEDSISSLSQTPQANNKVNNLLNECLLLLQCVCIQILHILI